ncbi:hypothetical protein ACE7GA_16140 [Roseomonas sp. CCTCC AB2023176]|uniref:hypothetical protein n=1 Tax=Roseomonas sp. CCTCC AB2023176 TaxID=3342640 RepID=UPI0035E16787
MTGSSRSSIDGTFLAAVGFAGALTVLALHDRARDAKGDGMLLAAAEPRAG